MKKDCVIVIMNIIVTINIIIFSNSKYCILYKHAVTVFVQQMAYLLKTFIDKKRNITGTQ